jgi:hypothetical protein
MKTKETRKKSYQTPELTVYGTVAEITQAFGNTSVADMVFIGSSNVQQGFPSVGSRDGVIQII